VRTRPLPYSALPYPTPALPALPFVKLLLHWLDSELLPGWNLRKKILYFLFKGYVFNLGCPEAKVSVEGLVTWAASDPVWCAPCVPLGCLQVPPP